MATVKAMAVDWGTPQKTEHLTMCGGSGPSSASEYRRIGNGKTKATREQVVDRSWRDVCIDTVVRVELGKGHDQVVGLHEFGESWRTVTWDVFAVSILSGQTVYGLIPLQMHRFSDVGQYRNGQNRSIDRFVQGGIARWRECNGDGAQPAAQRSIE